MNRDRDTRPPNRGRRDPFAGNAHRKPLPVFDSYREDPLYPRIVRAVETILEHGGIVSPIDVMVGMGLLTLEDLGNWRCGRVPYLERVIHGNLTRLSRLLRILRFHAHDLRLVPSLTACARRAGGGKHPLRFTKTGDPRLEQAYATRFFCPGKGPLHPPAPQKNRE